MENLIRFAVICCAIALGLGSTSSIQAQQSQVSSYQGLSDKFFDLLKQDKSSDAVDFLFSTNPTLKKMPDKADQIKAQFTSLRTVAGPYLSHTTLVESKVAGIYVYQHYFVAYERQPISVRITYYKPAATWVCQSLQFDVNVDDAIQKAADSNIRFDAH